MSWLSRLYETVKRWWCGVFNCRSPLNGNYAGRYLLVGINKYPTAPLAGCVNDIRDIKALLVDVFGVNPRDIRVLTDHKATAAAIRSHLEWLSDTAPGQVAYFHFSGHGVQVPFGTAEQDGLSEAICPYDFNWTPEKTIVDDEFARIFAKIRHGVRFYWTSDSCHSGDLVRSAGGEAIRSMPVPPEIQEQIRRLRSQARPANRLMERARDLDVAFVSGCKSYQTAADTYIMGRPCGAFSHFFAKSIRSNIGQPVKNAAEKTRSELRKAGYSQEPTVEGVRMGMPFLG